MVENVLSYLREDTAGGWHDVAAPQDVVPVGFVAGDLRLGPIVAGGQGGLTIAYSKDWKQWVNLDPPGINLEGLAGNNFTGPIIAHDKNRVSYFSAGQWQTVPPDAPWTIEGIAGEITRGVLIFGGPDGDSVAYSEGMDSFSWKILPRAPFRIHGIAGENTAGPLIYGGDDRKRFACMTDYASGQWKTPADPPVSVRAITGNNGSGPLILGADNRVYFMTYEENKWRRLAPLIHKAVDIAGDNDNGPLLGNAP